jgi:hypothetical protein
MKKEKIDKSGGNFLHISAIQLMTEERRQKTNSYLLKVAVRKKGGKKHLFKASVPVPVKQGYASVGGKPHIRPFNKNVVHVVTGQPVPGGVKIPIVLFDIAA